MQQESSTPFFPLTLTLHCWPVQEDGKSLKSLLALTILKGLSGPIDNIKVVVNPYIKSMLAPLLEAGTAHRQWF